MLIWEFIHQFKTTLQSLSLTQTHSPKDQYQDVYLENQITLAELNDILRFMPRDREANERSLTVLIEFLGDRWARINNTDADYCINYYGSANQQCIALAQKIAHVTGLDPIKLLMPTVKVIYTQSLRASVMSDDNKTLIDIFACLDQMKYNGKKLLHTHPVDGRYELSESEKLRVINFSTRAKRYYNDILTAPIKQQLKSRNNFQKEITGPHHPSNASYGASSAELLGETLYAIAEDYIELIKTMSDEDRNEWFDFVSNYRDLMAERAGLYEDNENDRVEMLASEPFEERNRYELLDSAEEGEVEEVRGFTYDASDSEGDESSVESENASDYPEDPGSDEEADDQARDAEFTDSSNLWFFQSQNSFASRPVWFDAVDFKLNERGYLGTGYSANQYGVGATETKKEASKDFGHAIKLSTHRLNPKKSIPNSQTDKKESSDIEDNVSSFENMFEGNFSEESVKLYESINASSSDEDEDYSSSSESDYASSSDDEEKDYSSSSDEEDDYSSSSDSEYASSFEEEKDYSSSSDEDGDYSSSFESKYASSSKEEEEYSSSSDDQDDSSSSESEYASSSDDEEKDYSSSSGEDEHFSNAENEYSNNSQADLVSSFNSASSSETEKEVSSHLEEVSSRAQEVLSPPEEVSSRSENDYSSSPEEVSYNLDSLFELKSDTESEKISDSEDEIYNLKALFKTKKQPFQTQYVFEPVKNSRSNSLDRDEEKETIDYFSDDSDEQDFYHETVKPPQVVIEKVAILKSLEKAMEEKKVSDYLLSDEGSSSEEDYYSDNEAEYEELEEKEKEIETKPAGILFSTSSPPVPRFDQKRLTSNEFVLKLMDCDRSEWMDYVSTFKLKSLQDTLLKNRPLSVAIVDSSVYSGNELHDRVVLFLFLHLYRQALMSRDGQYNVKSFAGSFFSRFTGYDKDTKLSSSELFLNFLLSDKSLTEIEGFINGFYNAPCYGPLTQYNSDLGLLTSQAIIRSKELSQFEDCTLRKRAG